MSLNPPWRQNCDTQLILPKIPTMSTGLAMARSLTPFASAELLAPAPLTLETDLADPVAASLCITVDDQGMIGAVNSLGATALGYSVAHLVGSAMVNLVHPQDHDRWQKQQNGFYHLVRQDGSITRQFLTAQTLQSMGGQVTLWVGSEVQSLHATTRNSASERIAEVLGLQAAWKRLMQAIAFPVRHSLPLKQILKVTATAIQEILTCDRVLVYRLHPNTAGSVTIEVGNPDCPAIRREPHTAAICYQKSRLLKRIDRAFATPALEPGSYSPQWLNLLYQMEATAEIVVPILSQQDGGEAELWGLLIVQQCHRPRYWKEWEVELLNQLVTHLGIVVQQAELNQRNQRWNANLERQIRARTSQLQLAYDFEATLKRITDAVRDSLEEHQILQVVLQEVAGAIGVNCCNASLYDLENRTSTVHYEYTNSLSPYQGRVVQMSGSPEIYAQLVQGQAFQFCSLNPNLERGRVVMLACPMKDDQGVVGDLWLINQPGYRFTEQDIRLVQQVANQCAIAIRQARLFQAAQAQVKELERLNQLKDDFLSTVSHELRTPMTNIKLAIQMLEVVLKPTGLIEDVEHRASQYFKILQTECRREIGLINDLLDLSRLEAGSEPLVAAKVDLFTWLPSLTQSFVERAHSHHQRLLLNLEPALPEIMTDLSHLERILSELLQNACKYTPAGEKIVVATELAAGETDGIVVSVCNTGIEIPPEELSRIFEKFYRIPNHDPWQHGGTGLGLALVAKLAEHLGGSLSVASGGGETCFRLALPLAVREGDPGV
jgi:signal transduction histidine kinase